jgi:hypothetical protein
MDEDGIPHRCDNDLVRSLRLYTSFIRRFCTKLHALTINFSEDRGYDEDQELPSWRPRTTGEAIVKLLERHIFTIRTLKVLRVVREGPDGDINCDYAVPIICAIEERAAVCDFCGENHLWVLLSQFVQ